MTEPLWYDSDDKESGERSKMSMNQFIPLAGISLDSGAMTMDRKTGKKFEKINSTGFGTLPRPAHSQQNSNLANGAFSTATIRAIGVVSNLFHTNKEANIIEEELQYLRAVDSGDIKAVEEILITNENNEEEKSNGSKMNITKSGFWKNSDNQVNINRTNNEDSEDVFELNINNEIDATKNGPLTKSLGKDKPRNTLPVPSRNRSQTMWHSGSTYVRNPLPVTQLKKRSSSELLSGDLKDTELSDRLRRTKRVKFNKNCKDQWGRSALFLAVIHRDLDMLQLLLKYKVKHDECLYHAIDFGFYDVVDVFMKNDKDTSQKITGEQSFYAPGLTPLQLAAHRNDYVMLRILHENGYSINMDTKSTMKPLQFFNYDRCGLRKRGVSVLDRAWDAANHQLLCYRAICSPAYLIMTFDEGIENNNESWDFLDNIFSLYGELRNKIAKEPAVQSLYLPLANQVEDFACDLLSEVRSSSDLANLLRFDPPGQRRLTSQRNYLTPVQKAIEVRMKRFVAHENSQLAVSSLRLGTLFYSEDGYRTLVKRILLAFIFPVLCIAFSIAPHSRIGELLSNPMVNMSCHIMSDFIFVFLMIIRLFLLTHLYPCDCVGTAVYPIDWVILVWVMARIFNQIRKLRETSIRKVLLDVWMINDLFTSLCFMGVIGFKIYDLSVYTPILGPFECPAENDQYSNLSRRCTRSEWKDEEIWLITISETLLAIIYFLICLRAMEILYTDRTFGPLQLSLDKMSIDTFRFLTIFLVTFLGFSFAMTQLYWTWGKPYSFSPKLKNSSLKLCDQNANSSDVCIPAYSFPLNSILEQYWTLYGYGWGREPPKATTIPTIERSGFTAIAGQIASATFHLWAVVVMLNVLVAMLSHSFDRVRNNAELEWKFHRSRSWMKFIRKGVYPRPPPMNLVPSTRDIRSFCNFFKDRFSTCCPNRPSRHNVQRDSSEGIHRENDLYRQALRNITERYTRRYLLPDFRHNGFEQQLQQQQQQLANATTRNGSNLELDVTSS